MDSSKVKMISHGLSRWWGDRGILPASYAIGTKDHQSAIEYILCEWLKRAGIKNIRCQEKIGQYYVDLFMESGYGKIAIECDGEEYHQDIEKDRKRDDFIRSQGIIVLRFSGVRIMNDAFECVKEVVSYLPEIRDTDEWQRIAYSPPMPEYDEWND